MPPRGRSVPAAISALKKARPKVVSMPMTSPVERISGPSVLSTSGKRLNGSTASFTATCPPVTGGWSRPSSRSSASVAPSMTRAATLASGTPVALATKGTVRLARGLASMTKTSLPRTAYWTLIEPAHVEGGGDGPGVGLDHVDQPALQRGRRDGAGRVAAVHAGLLDVLHHPADQHLAGGVADGVHVDLDRVLEEAVDEHRTLDRQAALAIRGCRSPAARSRTGRPWRP